MRCILEPLRDLEAPAALSDQANETSLGAKLSDLGNRANTEAVLATADLPATFDQHHAKSRVLILQ
jgi:hypothetical protein